MQLKHLHLVFFAGMLFTNVLAQPVIQYQRTIGGNSADILTCIYLTKDGGLIAGGYSSSDASGEKTQNNRGKNDYWVVKLDSKGNIQWDQTIGGHGKDVLFLLQQLQMVVIF